MQSTADDENRRILLNSIEKNDNIGRITNLLAGEWSKQPESFADLLKSLRVNIINFIKNA
jgi:hypothetical protein